MFGSRVPSSARSQAGVSLVEVMIALAVLVIGLGYLIQHQTESLRQAAELRTQIRAQKVAVAKAEELKAAPYANLVQAVTSGNKIEAKIDLGAKEKDARWSAELQQSNDSPASIKIRSVVEWKGRKVEQVGYAFE